MSIVVANVMSRRQDCLGCGCVSINAKRIAREQSRGNCATLRETLKFINDRTRYFLALRFTVIGFNDGIAT